MSIISLTSYDVMEGKLTVSGYLMVTWTDELLHWNISKFGGVTRIPIGIDEIWAPHLQHSEETDDDYASASTWLHSNGSVYMVLSGVFVSYCETELFYFPFDNHTCTLSLIAIGSDASELNLKLLHNQLQNSDSVKHGEWLISLSKAYIIQYQEPDIFVIFVGYGFDLLLKRRPEFIILHTVIPLVLIGLLNMIIYLVPVQSGERVSFSVTVLLALIFFTSSVSDNIPKNAIKIPILSMISIAVIGLCTMNVIVSVVFSRIGSENNRPVSGCLRSLTRVYNRIRIGKLEKVSLGCKAAESDLPMENSVDTGKEITDDNDEMTAAEKAGDGVEITWIMVVDVLDRILFNIYLLIVISAGLIAFVKFSNMV